MTQPQGVRGRNADLTGHHRITGSVAVGRRPVREYLVVGSGMGWNVAGTVLKKERSLALHQTGLNSGVVRAGPYYAPGR